MKSEVAEQLLPEPDQAVVLLAEMDTIFCDLDRSGIDLDSNERRLLRNQRTIALRLGRNRLNGIINDPGWNIGQRETAVQSLGKIPGREGQSAVLDLMIIARKADLPDHLRWMAVSQVAPEFVFNIGKRRFAGISHTSPFAFVTDLSYYLSPDQSHFRPSFDLPYHPVGDLHPDTVFVYDLALLQRHGIANLSRGRYINYKALLPDVLVDPQRDFGTMQAPAAFAGLHGVFMRQMDRLSRLTPIVGRLPDIHPQELRDVLLSLGKSLEAFNEMREYDLGLQRFLNNIIKGFGQSVTVATEFIEDGKIDRALEFLRENRPQLLGDLVVGYIDTVNPSGTRITPDKFLDKLLGLQMKRRNS